MFQIIDCRVTLWRLIYLQELTHIDTMANISAASRLCRNVASYGLWAKSVNLNMQIREGNLPDRLQRLLVASQQLPAWAADEVAFILYYTIQF
jgi:hypothetical protein